MTALADALTAAQARAIAARGSYNPAQWDVPF